MNLQPEKHIKHIPAYGYLNTQIAGVEFQKEKNNKCPTSKGEPQTPSTQKFTFHVAALNCLPCFPSFKYVPCSIYCTAKTSAVCVLTGPPFARAY